MALPRKAFERAVIVRKDNFKHQDYSVNQPVYVGRQLNEIKDDLAFHNLENAKSNYTKKKKPKESNGNDYFDVFYSDYSHQKKEREKDNSNDYFDVHYSDYQLKKKQPPKNRKNEFGKNYDGGGKKLNSSLTNNFNLMQAILYHLLISYNLYTNYH